MKENLRTFPDKSGICCHQSSPKINAKKSPPNENLKTLNNDLKSYGNIVNFDKIKYVGNVKNSIFVIHFVMPLYFPYDLKDKFIKNNNSMLMHPKYVKM